MFVCLFILMMNVIQKESKAKSLVAKKKWKGKAKSTPPPPPKVKKQKMVVTEKEASRFLNKTLGLSNNRNI